MPAMRRSPAGFTVGSFGLGMHGKRVGTVAEAIHDGDTVSMRAYGDFSVRLLGVDSAETSFNLPGEKVFKPITHAAWATFLGDPATAAHLPDGLRQFIEARLGPETAANHARHALRAQRAFEAMVAADIAELDLSREQFGFFLAFAGEAIDRYGRLLAFVNREQHSGERPRPYNERILASGDAAPYFIWPNVNPFRRPESPVVAARPPKAFRTMANRDPTLKRVRADIASARAAGKGVYSQDDGLLLSPFELRYLARRSPPDRWVIDLGASDDVLHPPASYFRIQNHEDRLWIPAEYVELFVSRGWRRGE